MEDVSEFQIKSVLFLQGFSILQLLMMWNWGKSVGSLKINRERKWVFSDKGVSIFGKRTISSYPFSMFETMDNLVFLASQNGRLAYYDVNTMQFNIVPFQEKIQTYKRKLKC